MDGFATESFIDFCDSMMIAEEGIGSYIKEKNQQRADKNAAIRESLKGFVPEMKKIQKEVKAGLASKSKVGQQRIDVGEWEEITENLSNYGAGRYSYRLLVDVTRSGVQNSRSGMFAGFSSVIDEVLHDVKEKHSKFFSEQNAVLSYNEETGQAVHRLSNSFRGREYSIPVSTYEVTLTLGSPNGAFWKKKK